MGKATQYRNWAVTWKADGPLLPETSRDGVRYSGGNYIYRIFVGPQESPDKDCTDDHQHVMVHCETSNISKKKVKEALVGYSSLAAETVEEKVIYISKLYSTKSAYVMYCFKSDGEGVLGKDDTIVIDTIDNLKTEGRTPTAHAIKRKLIDDHGASAYNKRFCKVAETYLLETDVTDSRGNPKVVLDSKVNCTNFLTMLLSWFIILGRTKVQTHAKPFDTIPEPILKQVAFLISLIPYFSRRVQGMADCLPALYLWGIQSAGKSSVFSNCRFIKKIPTDSSGVSRFRMDKMHTAVLLDDVESDTINHKENSSTLKQLTLGNDVEVKTMGSTQSIKGFVVITSNSPPSYLNDKAVSVDEKGNEDTFINRDIVNASWKRRFITCEFVNTCPFDYVCIDYDDFKLRDVAAQLFRANYIQIYSTHPEFETIMKPLEVYYNVAVDDYASENGDDWFSEMYDTATDRITDMIKENNLEAMMASSISTIKPSGPTFPLEVSPPIDIEVTPVTELENEEENMV